MSKKATGIRVVRQWCNGWERWESIPSTPVVRSLELAVAGEGDLFAVPARQVVAVPLWLDSDDPAVVEASVLLELEVRGFASEGALADVSVREVTKENGRTLVVVSVFPSDFEKRFPDVAAQRYEVSASLLPLDEDALTVWREGGEIVAAYTRGKTLVYWTTWDAAATGREIQTWLKSTTLGLLASGFISRRPAQVVVDDGFNVSDLGFEFIPVVRPLGPPALEMVKCDWRPASAVEAERRRLGRAQFRRIGLAVAVAYALLVFIAGGYLVWLNIQGTRLSADIDSLRAEATQIQPMIRQWQSVGPSIDSRRFPLEILRQVVESLPPQGIRLTIFDVTPERITVEGEAISASHAAKYFETVSHQSGMTDIDWQMPPPALLPNNTARFQIVGTSR
ncbi:hypothetical protein TSACC_22675 [Terrimicrobium sacchariphilum]|uniref:Uncharacterized protein n=1 Tax=Terrimicrobium sacchariphilum TaxID=690879 RepID=A0A146G9W4_TERSA|nr:hypothetical protein [Terrimicrobium sacchariphilum]GAT34250.1 hypothetical protein TSACC_22675 [Terrimicrobium sacchariphilum]